MATAEREGYIMMAAQPALPPGFAIVLAQRHGVGTAAEAQTEPGGLAASTELPLHVALFAFRNGSLVFDFSACPDLCGGPLPALRAGKMDPKYDAAEKVRGEIAFRRVAFMNAFVATMWIGGQQATYGWNAQQSVNLGSYFPATRMRKHWTIALDHQPMEPTSFVPIAAVEEAARILRSVHAVFGPSTFELLPLLQHAGEHYRNHQFSSCLLIGWSVVEALLNRKWDSALKARSTRTGGHTSIGKERLKKLSGRDYSASVMCEVLSLLGELDDATLDQLNLARKSRNDFAHALVTVSPEDASRPLQLASQLISQSADVPFGLDLSYFRHF